jgi:type IV pilus assembly protein PilN
MIRINLLAVERAAAKKVRSGGGGVTTAQRVTIGAALILLSTLVTIGWWYWSLHTRAIRLDEEIATAEVKAQQLRSVLAQVQKFETRKAVLQQRVTLIEQLRKDQIGPVHMLDQISLALPPSIWLNEMKQTATPNEVLIDGRSLTLTGLSDFVANLEKSGYFQKSVEIVNSTADTTAPALGEVIKFEIKAIFKGPGDIDTAAKVADTKGATGQLKNKS